MTVAAAAVAAYRLHKNALATLFSVFVLLCFTNFLEHAFRVRNDSFAVMFAMLSLVAMLRVEKPRWSTYAAGLFGGAAFLCTQKSVYQIAPLVLAQIDDRAGSSAARAMRSSALCVMAPAARSRSCSTPLRSAAGTPPA